jgi:ComF family protein
MLSNFTALKFDSAASRGRHPARSAGGAFVALLRHALPQACTLCAAPSGDSLLCGACRDGMPRVGVACPRCALPSEAAVACVACVAAPPPYATTIAAWRYAFPADRLLQAFKYGGQLALAAPLAGALADAVAASGAAAPDGVVAVPLSRERQRQRGFNQAQEIARGVAALAGIPLLAGGLQRTRDSLPQAGLHQGARSHNIRGAFECAAPLGGRTIALVDDVMTTGATLAAAAGALRDAGARRVDAWVVARTLLS